MRTPKVETGKVQFSICAALPPMHSPKLPPQWGIADAVAMPNAQQVPGVAQQVYMQQMPQYQAPMPGAAAPAPSAPPQQCQQCYANVQQLPMATYGGAGYSTSPPGQPSQASQPPSAAYIPTSTAARCVVRNHAAEQRCSVRGSAGFRLRACPEWYVPPEQHVCCSAAPAADI